MKIPKQIKIGGHQYKVQFHKEGEVCKDEANCGISLRTKGVIEINGNLMKTEQESTFIHEIFHILNSEIDHALLDSLSQQFYQVLKDNNLIT